MKKRIKGSCIQTEFIVYVYVCRRTSTQTSSIPKYLRKYCSQFGYNKIFHGALKYRRIFIEQVQPLLLLIEKRKNLILHSSFNVYL